MPDRLTTRSQELAAESAARAPLLLPPRNAWVELGLFVLVIMALELYVPTFDLLRVEPNPCWLPVLLLSVQYGTVSGLLAAATCIGLSIQTGFPEQEIGENLFVYLLRAWAQPMLWIGAAVLLGQFRTRHIVERAELRQELATLSSQRTAIADYARNLRQRCDVLERHIAGGNTLEPIGVLALLARIGDGADDDVRDTFRECIAAVLPGATISLARLGPAGLTAIAVSQGREDDWPASIDAATTLVRELIARRMPLSILTADGERALDGRALVAVPIEAGDMIAGAILVHEIEPQALTVPLVDALAVIGAAFAPLLAPRPAVASLGGTDSLTTDGASTTQTLLKRLWRPFQRSESAEAAALARSQSSPRRMLR